MDFGLKKREGVLYPDVPDQIWPVVFVTAIVLFTLFFEATGGYKTNPVIFFSLPALYFLVFMVTDTPPAILRTIGFVMPTAWSKVVGFLSAPIGWFVGYGLAWLSAGAGLLIIPIALYPFNLISTGALSTTGFQLATMAPSVGIWFYLLVAFFEEGSAIYMGKNIGNWLYPTINTPWVAEITGLTLSRVVWASWHWFAYGGFSNPLLYVTAIGLGMVFYLLGLGAGYLMFKDRVDSNFIVPFCIIPAIAAHWAFDYGLLIFLSH